MTPEEIRQAILKKVAMLHSMEADHSVGIYVSLREMHCLRQDIECLTEALNNA